MNFSGPCSATQVVSWGPIGRERPASGAFERKAGLTVIGKTSTLLTFVIGALLIALEAFAGPQPPSDQTAFALRQWTAAVLEHVPGVDDAALAAARAVLLQDSRQLGEMLEVFFTALAEPVDEIISGQASGGGSIVKGTKSTGGTVALPTEVDKLRDAAHDLALRGGRRAFLLRAAVFHSDAALASPAVVLSIPSDDRSTSARLPFARDGQAVGTVEQDRNWEFARTLLDHSSAKPGEDALVRQWYHATGAYLLRNGLYAEARAHFERAAKLTPNDPLILYDRGCLAEALGLAFSQQVVSNEARLAARLAAQPRPTAPGVPVTGRSMPDPLKAGAFGNLPSQDEANAEAERLFRKALDVSPSMAEARIRLARLLEVRGKLQEAENELNRALDAHASVTDPIVSFYGHLFASRAAGSRSTQDGREQARRALALFPRSQSALLAESRLAFLGSDVDAALMPFRGVEQPPPGNDSRDDPWWVYHYGPGRDAESLLRDLWAKTAIQDR